MTQPHLEFHEIAELFPMLGEEELQAQAADIKKNGLVHAILLFEGKILDGRNRYVACGMANVPPRFDTFDGTFSDAITRVWSENIHRRDLTSSQRAAIAVSREDIVEQIEADAKQRQVSAGKLYGESHTKEEVVETFPEPLVPPPERSRDIIAKTADTNPRYVSDAKKIKKESPEVFDMVKTGSLSIPDATKIANLESETQDKVIDKIKTSPNTPIKKAIQTAKRETNEDNRRKKESINTIQPNELITVIEGDMFDKISNVCNKSISLLCIDPPYNVKDDVDWDDIGTDEDYVAFTERYMAQVLPKLKDEYNGFVFCDARYGTKIEQCLLGMGMNIKNRLVWHRRNMAMGRKVSDRFISSYEIVFLFGNRELNIPDDWDDTRFDVQTFAVPQTNFKDEKVHQTQKPIALLKWLIQYGTFDGDVVLDCFAGSGTTGAACKELGRECVLIEREHENILKIYDRLGMI